MTISKRTPESSPEKAFLVVCVHGQEESTLGFSNDIEIDDYLEELEALKIWDRVDFYSVEDAELVWSVERPKSCNHSDEVLIDESPSGCEYQCTSCAKVRFESHLHFNNPDDIPW